METLIDPNLPFSLTTLTFHARVTRRLVLPEFKGSTFRGCLGYALKELFCQRPGGGRVCRDCSTPKQCGYAYIFETPKAFGSETFHQAANLPHPFVLTPPLTPKRVFEPGEVFTFSLTVIGAAIHLTENFIEAIQIMGRAGMGSHDGAFEIEKIVNLDGAAAYDSRVETSREIGVCAYSFFVEQAEAFAGNELRISFLAPTRILQKNKPTTELTFELFLRNILRRASWLAEIHCGEKWQLNYGAILEQARSNVKTVERKLEWVDWQRRSNRQHRTIRHGGFVGSALFEGKLSLFLPLILLGRYLHIGGKTTLGVGKYVVER